MSNNALKRVNPMTNIKRDSIAVINTVDVQRCKELQLDPQLGAITTSYKGKEVHVPVAGLDPYGDVHSAKLIVDLPVADGLGKKRLDFLLKLMKQTQFAKSLLVKRDDRIHEEEEDTVYCEVCGDHYLADEPCAFH